jgi:prepilin-type N-terminal cleavage/methylation domain-containing protein
MTYRQPRRRPSEQDGFTLIELVISMAVIGIIFMVFSVVMGSTIRTSTEVQEDSVLQGEVRATVDTIAKDLRQAYTGNGTPALETMTGTQLQFLSPDRKTPFHLRRISYRLTGGQIQRAMATSTNTGQPPWTFPALSGYLKQVGSVKNAAIFAYYDANGAVTTNPGDVAGVTITVVVANAQAPGRQFTYATSVALRVNQ